MKVRTLTSRASIKAQVTAVRDLLALDLLPRD